MKTTLPSKRKIIDHESSRKLFLEYGLQERFKHKSAGEITKIFYSEHPEFDPDSPIGTFEEVVDPSGILTDEMFKTVDRRHKELMTEMSTVSNILHRHNLARLRKERERLIGQAFNLEDEDGIVLGYFRLDRIDKNNHPVGLYIFHFPSSEHLNEESRIRIEMNHTADWAQIDHGSDLPIAEFLSILKQYKNILDDYYGILWTANIPAGAEEN